MDLAWVIVSEVGSAARVSELSARYTATKPHPDETEHPSCAIILVS